MLLGKGQQHGVGLGQPGATQERQRRGAVAFTVAVLVDFHHAPGADDDRVMGLVEGQHMQNIAVGVDLRAHRMGQVELPVEHMLVRAFQRSQAQILDAAAHFVGVVVGGVVTD